MRPQKTAKRRAQTQRVSRVNNIRDSATEIIDIGLIHI